MRSQLNKMLLSFTGALVLFLIGLVIYTGLQQNKVLIWGIVRFVLLVV
ncbi:Uncharacterised protein [Weissella viridescens]|uniref:Uncharacterized protein n=1 Tax=Weissella viridescens TaxID=1629 RepID=A0A380NWQ3_WEIVI|nr:Uncharacterised protein [Weissella viridescens]